MIKHVLIEWQADIPPAVQVRDLLQLYREGSWESLIFHIYSGITDRGLIKSVASSLREFFPDAQIAGALAGGEILDGRVLPQGILVSAMLFEHSRTCLHRIDGISGSETAVGQQIRSIIQDTPQLKGVELLLPGTRVITRHILDELDECREGVWIFGGYAGGHGPTCPDQFVFCEDAILEDSVLVITYTGDQLHIDAGKSIGWQKLGMPFQVTRADENRLIELGGRPAVEFYEEFLKIDRCSDRAVEDIFEFPLMADMNGQEVLRSVMNIEPDGTLLLTGFITEGADVYLSYGSPSDIIEKVDERLDSLRGFHPQAILLYSCLTRKAFWSDFMDIEMLPFARFCPTAGFHTWGEICSNLGTVNPLEYNITMVSVAFREGDAPEFLLPPVRVDDSVLKGQAALLQRLTRMVYATTEGLRIAYRDLQDLNRRLKSMAEHDSLTGIYNRGRIEQLINEALDHSAATGHTMSLLMLDIDFFKKVNDTFGHETGDIILREIASMLEAAAGRIPGAKAGRWGGEEFFILLPETESQPAVSFAEELRGLVDRHDFPEVHHLSISIGLISTQGREDRRRIYSAVDDALYQAKRSGRNCVVLYHPD